VLQARPFRISGLSGEETATEATTGGVMNKARSRFRLAVTAILTLLLAIGAVYYFAAVF